MKCDFVFLKPGEWILADAPTHVKTILGSCVAITVRSPRLGLAAMTHCLLPSAGEAIESLEDADAARYVDSALDIVFDKFAQRGALPSELEVKLVGGADGLTQDLSRGRYSVGARNVRTALGEIAKRGITPSASVVGGQTGRVMVFDTATGDLFVKRLTGSLPERHRSRQWPLEH
jgi:chemotaxis protein CheD